MGTMTLQGCRDYVRGILDLDVDDLPDSILDVYIREGYRKTSRFEQNWPFYWTSVTAVTVAGQAAYSLTGLGVERIQVVVGPHGPLQAVDRFKVRNYFTGTSTTGEPRFWSIDPQNVTFWPTPDSAYTFTIEGFRSPGTFPVASGSVLDLPADFDEVVCQWALSRAYFQQDDTELGALHATEWEKATTGLREVYQPLEETQPLVLNRGMGLTSLDRLPFPFEV